jgi:hypothetical protein
VTPVGQTSKTTSHWELGETRTNPSDHKALEEKDINSYLKTTAKGDKSAFRILNDELTSVESSGKRDDKLRGIIDDARRLTEIPFDFEQHRNHFQSKFLWAMTKTEGSDDGLKKINDIIEEYQEARMKVCMLNADFQAKVKNSENGHIYLKALRERVIDELQILQDTSPQELTFNQLQLNETKHLKYDVESLYNLQNVNNTDAMGFDNLDERGAAEKPADKFNAAHQNVFDKMLADYYLSQRG